MTSRLVVSTRDGRRIETDLPALLPADLREETRVEANRWIKRLRLVPYGGASMRGRFTYRGDSLWWFTELYLHKVRRLERAVSAVLALDALVARDRPTRIDVSGGDPVVAAAARAFGAARNIPVEAGSAGSAAASTSVPSFLIGLTARLSRLRPSARAGAGRPRVAAFVHTAFWRETGGESDGPQQERYIGAVLDAIAGEAGEAALQCVGVGPRRNFRARRWWDPVTAGAPSRLITPIERLAPWRALAGSRDLWARRRQLAADITSGDGIRDAAVFRGCNLWEVLREELEGVALLQWPWSARAMDEAGAALDALQPGAALTYAEAGGWGRALVLEARRRGVPSVGMQHGFIYRHWLNYQHEPDELDAVGDDRGFPAPTRTLLFDRYAERHLIDSGRLPKGSLGVVGSPGLDALAARAASLRASRESLRAEWDATGRPLLVFAAKFSEVRDSLPALVAAVRALPDVRMLIKPHPAERPDDYAPVVGDAPNIRVTPVDADLAALVVAADAVATMNSTVALDAVALGVPALVIGVPSNLSPFVDQGVMLGVPDAATMRPRVEGLLYDAESRRRLREAGAEFAARNGMAPDGRAAARAAAEVLTLAGRRDASHA